VQTGWPKGRDHHALRQWGWTTVCLLTSTLGLACSSEKADFTPSLDAHSFYATLAFTNHAINLATAAPYDTMQLHVRAEMQDGTPVPGTVVYSTSDDAVEISTDGLLTALHATTRTVIRASLTHNGLTRTDSAVVSVLNGSPVSLLKRLAIEPAPGDSAKMASQLSIDFGQSNKNLNLVRNDSLGNDMPNLLVAVHSSDTTVAKVSQSGGHVVVKALQPGRVTLSVSTYAYGTTKQDSLPFVAGWPLSAALNVYARTVTGSKNTILDFFPGTYTVGVGACVVWGNADTAQSIDVVFDDPSAVTAPTGLCALVYSGADAGAGNIPAFHEKQPGQILTGFAGRSFLQAGRYPYHSDIYGTSGVIVVCDELHDSSCFPY
jgi:hypothetical protein